MKRVAIVGGGACGIVMLKSILEQKWDVEVMLFESSDCIGGTWVYNSDAKDNNQTAMYENLRTNLPKDCMGFLNHPFPSNKISNILIITTNYYLTPVYTLFHKIVLKTSIIIILRTHK